MKKKFSFSTSIIKTIRLIFGIAFAVIFIGEGILLYLTETDKGVLYIKIGATFVAFLSLYLLSVIYIGRKLKKQFAPLDKLAIGLKDNSIEIFGDNDDIKSFAKELKNEIERLDDLNNELNATKNNLDDVYLANEKTISSTIDNIEECKKLLVKSDKRQKRIKESIIQNDSVLEELMNTSYVIKQKQKILIESKDALLNSSKSNLKTGKDIVSDYDKVTESYTLIQKTLSEAVSLIDSLFSELSIMQNIASQMNLYAMNSTLEASRSGIFNINITNALDEIRDLSTKMQAKSDDVALLSIQSKNSLNLALEQATFCKEQSDDNLNEINVSIDKLSGLSDSIVSTLESIDNIVDETNNVLIKLEIMDEGNNALIKDIDYTMDTSKSIGNKLFDIDKSLKNNAF